MFIAAGQKYGVSPYLLAAQAKTESMGFNKAVIECRLDSPAGAKGISQFMPATAKSWKVDPCNVESSIDGQARFMKALIDKFHSEELALAAYNSGPGRVAKLGRVPRIPETLRYLDRVAQYRKEMGE